MLLLLLQLMIPNLDFMMACFWFFWGGKWVQSKNARVGKETKILRISYIYLSFNLKYLDTSGILSLVFPCYDQFGFGGSNEPLYTSKDVGITLVNHSNLKNVILESDTAWMVEFYSSWCGHCIRFAPVFKELGTNVEGKFNVYR